MFVEPELFRDMESKVPNSTITINGVKPALYTSIELPYLVEITAPDGKVFNSSSGGYDPIEDTTRVFTIVGDGTTITRNFTDIEFDPRNWTFGLFDGVVTPPEPTYDLVITQDYIDMMTGKKISVFINDLPIVDGDGYNYPFTVKLVVDDTHKITTNTSEYYDVVDDEYAKFTVTENPKILTRVFTEYDLYKFTQQTALDESVVVPDKIAYNDVFVLTPEQARTIATTQFTYWKQPSNIGQGGESTPLPQGDNIISFIDLPFIIDPSLIQGFKNIKVGIVDSFISAAYLNIDSYKLDLGSISVPDDKENFLSYENVTTILHLPYTNPINIDVDYVIGQTIHISYDVNFYDGIASVNITSSKIGGVIDTKSIKLNINIPFGKPDDNPSDNSPRNIDFGIDNGVLRPYIEVLRNDAVLENGFFTIPVVDEQLLYTQSGFIKIDEINLMCSASRVEKEMILNVINEGVIIK